MSHPMNTNKSKTSKCKKNIEKGELSDMVVNCLIYTLVNLFYGGSPGDKMDPSIYSWLIMKNKDRNYVEQL